jgi:hypothetical protein
VIDDNKFDLELYMDKAHFAAAQHDEPYAVVGGPYGFEVFKREYARRRYPDLIWYEAEPPL